jgi:hypothetical protein
MNNTIGVKNFRDVDAIDGCSRGINSPTWSRIKLVALPGREREASWLEARLNLARTSCGCEGAATALLLADLLYLTYLAVGTRGIWPPSVFDIGAGIAVCLAATIAGKTAGLLWARISIRLTLRKIRAYYRQHNDLRRVTSDETAERI